VSKPLQWELGMGFGHPMVLINVPIIGVKYFPKK